MKPVPLREAGKEEEFGGKAAQLAAAIQAGLPVPEGVALPWSFVDAVAQGDSEATAPLASLWPTLDYPIAVRSSAVGEDSVTASFAGQHLTHLNVVSAAGLVEAVAKVWASAHSWAALAYRHRLGLAKEPKIGVVLQRLVPADVAGLLFTLNPESRVDERVIEASWGLGEAVVAGLVTPDRYRISRKGEVLERTVGNKDTRVQLQPDGGTTETAVERALIRALCLTDSNLVRLHELAGQCEGVFGGIQDIEWAFESGDLFLLQRRSITRLSR